MTFQGILVGELSVDPLGRGYLAMSDDQVFSSLESVDRDNWVLITGADIARSIDQSEFDVKTLSERTYVQMVTGIADSVPSEPGSVVRSGLIAVFGAGSATAANLLAVANQQVSRAQELGLAGWLTRGRIASARLDV